MDQPGFRLFPFPVIWNTIQRGLRVFLDIGFSQTSSPLLLPSWLPKRLYLAWLTHVYLLDTVCGRLLLNGDKIMGRIRRLHHRLTGRWLPMPLPPFRSVYRRRPVQGLRFWTRLGKFSVPAFPSAA